MKLCPALHEPRPFFEKTNNIPNHGREFRRFVVATSHTRFAYHSSSSLGSVTLKIELLSIVSLFLFLSLLPVVHSQVSSSSSATASTVQVTIPNAAAQGPGYSPDVVTVVIGVNNTVQWTNRDAAVHTVTANDKSFDSKDMQDGQSYTFTFTTPGNYTYVCIYHSAMIGKVIVKPGSSSSSITITTATTTEFPANALVIVLFSAMIVAVMLVPMLNRGKKQ